MKYEYFVSYAHNSGFGSAYVTLEQKIDKRDILLEIVNKITQDANFSNQIVILNFILLGEIAE